MAKELLLLLQPPSVFCQLNLSLSRSQLLLALRFSSQVEQSFFVIIWLYYVQRIKFTLQTVGLKAPTTNLSHLQRSNDSVICNLERKAIKNHQITTFHYYNYPSRVSQVFYKDTQCKWPSPTDSYFSCENHVYVLMNRIFFQQNERSKASCLHELSQIFVILL